MRLINANSMKLEEFIDSKAPRYAILSHTWGNDEVYFRDMSDGPSQEVRDRKGYAKIEMVCKLAIRDGLNYAWVDTCCIDKSSSAELTEAINSMFQWYKMSAICYAYLSDLGPGILSEDGVPDCRWFTRGWTLQELIAPMDLKFFDAAWRLRGTKKSWEKLISKITGIPIKVLAPFHRLKYIAVAEKMSWASTRETTRVEDMAYCLLGIFNVNMPMLYGEGTKAFQRLQDEIIKREDDLTLFAWRPLSDKSKCYGLFALSPKVFSKWDNDYLGLRRECSVTNRGLRITTELLKLYAPSNERDSPHFEYLLPLARHLTQFVGIPLTKIGPDRYARNNCKIGGLMGDEVRAVTAGDGWIPEQTVYIEHSPEFQMTDRGLANIRLDCIELRLLDNLRVVEVFPRSRWDPSCSLVLHDSSGTLKPRAIALVLGMNSSFLPSIVVLLLSETVADPVYIIAHSAPVMEYILKHLSNLDPAELEDFWELRPLSPLSTKETRSSKTTIAETKVTVTLKAIAQDNTVSLGRGGSWDSRLKALTVGCMFEPV